jgi:ketosteroid isomerase-like protein
MTTPPSTTADNIALVRSAFDALNEGDIDTCLAHLNPDFVINLAGVPRCRAGRCGGKGLTSSSAASPTCTHTSRTSSPRTTGLPFRLTFRGTHRGEFLGIPATGRNVEYVSHEFYRIVDGVFAEEWICSDMAGLHGQLTAIAGT